MIILPNNIELQIRQHGEDTYPNECCGIILGNIDDDNEKSVLTILPISNSKEDDEQYHRFLITPEDLMTAELTARKMKLDILGFYHSHPDHPAQPSEYDKEHALPFYSYVIVAVEKGKSNELTSWELKEDRSIFIKEKIENII